MTRILSSKDQSMRFLLCLSVLVVMSTSVIAQETNVEKRPSLDLTGNKVFSKPELLAIVNTQLDEWAKAGSKYEPAMLDYMLHQMEGFMKSRGYLQSKVTKGDIEQTEAGPRMLLAVVEGPLYRVGKITVDGAQLISPAQVLEVLGLKTGEIANGKKVSEAMFEHLKNRYGKFGYIQYTAEIMPTFHAEIGDAEGVVDLKLTIDEGDQFTVRSVKIDSADKALTEVLTRELLLRAGDIYDNDLLRESVTRMNRTGLVATIDNERDVDFAENKRKTGEPALLDLIIHVRKAGALAAQR